MLAGVTAASLAIGTLTASAVSAYGDYEQLVGGVETLFKESGSKVIEYADNAYKTAGLSANEYMETVTGFSAALLQSLNNDTAKAAEKADTAITDMADNANKMGTSMEAIQNAYQGFAKQNYTMLDNLKLGYGGTKEEMERLLEDASKLSGIKYDISSYADIVDAIHVVQTEMDITGTTAKEASTTIQGSLSAMKASWQNLLVGIADDTQDFDGLLNNFVDSAVTVISNLLPRIQVIFNSIPKLIDGIAPQIPTMLQSILPGLIEGAISLINGLVNALPQMIGVLGDLVIMIGTYIIELLPTLVSVGMQIIQQLILGIGQAIPTLLPMIVTVVMSIVNFLIENIPLLLQGAIQLFTAIIQAIPLIITALVEQLPTIITTIIDTLLNNFDLLLDAAIELFMALVKAIPEVIVALVAALPEIIAALLNGLIEPMDKLFGGAWDSIVSIFSKAASWFGGVWSSIKGVFNSVVSFFKSTFLGAWNAVKGVFSGVGDFFKGIFDTIKNIFTTIGSSIGDAVSSAFKSAINWVLEKSVGLINGFISAINAAVGLINKIPGVSISKIDKLDVPQMEEGGVLKKGQVGLLEGNGAEAVVPLEKNRKWISRVAQDMETEFSGKEQNEKLDKIIALIENIIVILPDLMDGVSIGINNREFGRLVRQVST